MPVPHFQEWVAYFDEYPPFDGWEALALACTLLAAPWSKKRPRFESFLPEAYRRRLRPRRQSKEQMMAAMGVVAARADAVERAKRG